MAPPRVSIVVPTLNQGKTLAATLRSLVEQNYPDLELLVFDGGSTDNSVEIIRDFSHRLSYWTSEADSGQSDAIAKGLARATGDLFNWINSDDILLPGALNAVAETYQRQEADVLIGGAESVDEHGTVLRVWSARAPAGVTDFVTPSAVVMAQPACFLKRQLLLDVGGIAADLHYVMDWELYLRIAHRCGTRVRYAAIDRVLARALVHDASKTQSASPRFRDEARRVMQQILPELSPAAAAEFRAALVRVGIQDRVGLALSSSHPLIGLARTAIDIPAALRSRFFWGGLRRAFGRRRGIADAWDERLG